MYIRVLAYPADTLYSVTYSIFVPYGLNFVLFADVHGFHPHGPQGKETEPESSRTRERERKGHSPYQFPQGPREEKEREEMLLEQKSWHVWKEGQIKRICFFATRHFLPKHGLEDNRK